MINYNYLIETNPFKKIDLLFNLLKEHITDKNININNINTLIKNLHILIFHVIKKEKITSKQTKRLFFELLLNELQTILVLLEKKWLMRQYKKIKFLWKEVRKNLYLYLKKYDKYLIYLIYKIFTNYWTSIIYLGISTIIIAFLFWFLFFISDNIRIAHYVWWWKLQSIWYYFYVSLSTLSNLGWDTSMAWNNFLILLFSIEQVLWVLIFWFLINLFNNDLK